MTPMASASSRRRERAGRVRGASRMPAQRAAGEGQHQQSVADRAAAHVRGLQHGERDGAGDGRRGGGAGEDQQRYDTGAALVRTVGRARAAQPFQR